MGHSWRKCLTNDSPAVIPPGAGSLLGAKTRSLWLLRIDTYDHIQGLPDIICCFLEMMKANLRTGQTSIVKQQQPPQKSLLSAHGPIARFVYSEIPHAYIPSHVYTTLPMLYIVDLPLARIRLIDAPVRETEDTHKCRHCFYKYIVNNLMLGSKR